MGIELGLFTRIEQGLFILVMLVAYFFCRLPNLKFRKEQRKNAKKYKKEREKVKSVSYSYKAIKSNVIFSQTRSVFKRRSEQVGEYTKYSYCGVGCLC